MIELSKLFVCSLLVQVQQAPMTEHVSRLFLFSLMWSIGAFLELPQRKMLEEHLLSEHPGLDYPQIEKDSPETIFDYLVDENGELHKQIKKCDNISLIK